MGRRLALLPFTALPVSCPKVAKKLSPCAPFLALRGHATASLASCSASWPVPTA
jgi:hypothetical protein